MQPFSNRFRLITAVAALGITTSVAAAASDAPGFIDLGQSPPPGQGGTFIEVNLPRNLIAFAARLTGENEPEIAKLLNGLQSIHVNVLSIDDANRESLHQRTAHVLEQVSRDGWQRIVTVRGTAEQVDIYIKTRNDDVVEGLTVMVLNDDAEAVFVNIVGDIQPEQIALVGERFGIDPLKEIGVANGASL